MHPFKGSSPQGLGETNNSLHFWRLAVSEDLATVPTQGFFAEDAEGDLRAGPTTRDVACSILDMHVYIYIYVHGVALG